jgi:CheY-like chemotaxis protein
VAVVNDGQRAVEMCRRALPDAVFLDIEMPGMDGLAAARQIAEDPGTPVIIISAHGHPNLIDQAMAKLAETISQTDELLEAPQAGSATPRPLRRPSADLPEDE